MASVGEVVAGIATDSIIYMTPMVWAASGEAVAQQAGVLNVGLEGVMLIGALTAAIGFRVFGNLWAGWLLTVPVGILLGALLWFVYVYRQANQIVSGIMVDLAALGLTTVLFDRFLKGEVPVAAISNVRIPLLGKIPGIGTVVFDQTPIFYLSVVGCCVLYYVLWRSWFGMTLRACGEAPTVAAGSGVPVLRTRLVAEIIGCIGGALGGGALTVINTGSFGVDVTGGEGFIALAIIILARWNPLGIVLAAWVFGVAEALQLQLSTVAALSSVPHDVWLAAPYILTIVVIGRTRGTLFPSGTAQAWHPPGGRKGLGVLRLWPGKVLGRAGSE